MLTRRRRNSGFSSGMQARSFNRVTLLVMILFERLFKLALITSCSLCCFLLWVCRVILVLDFVCLVYFKIFVYVGL